MKCPRCKKEIKAEALFCTQCGLNLKENRETAEQTESSFGNFAQSYGNPYADDAYENVYGNGAYKKPQEGTSNEPVFDQKVHTNWQEGVGGSGIGQGFTAEFRNCEKTRYLAFMLGNWKTGRYYHGNNCPKILMLELGDFKTPITDISLFRE